jgi:putative redox protein
VVSETYLRWKASMTRIQCRYQGQLRCLAVHGPSGSELDTDAPIDNNGKGERFSPTDLIATALANCILTVMGIVAERHGLALEGAEVRVEKTMTSGAVRKIALLEAWISLPEGLEPQQAALLRRSAEGCPVKASLEGAVPMTLHWVDLSTVDLPPVDG